MKLSVKWLAALSVIALAAVAVVGQTTTSRAAVGQVFVTNNWSKITNQSPAPSGKLFGNPVYATYATTGSDDTTINKLIAPGSNQVEITVVDTGANPPDTEVDDNGTGGFAAGGTNPGDTFTVVLNDETKPIAGTISDIDLLATGTSTAVPTSQLEVTGFFAGDPDATPAVPGYVTIRRNVAGAIGNFDISYPTSGVDVVIVNAKSDTGSAGVTVKLVETSRSSNTYSGIVNLVENKTARTETQTLPTAGTTVTTQASLRVINGPVTVTYKDSDNADRTTQILIDTTPPTAQFTSPTVAATVNRFPTFSGTVNDANSGLKLIQQVSGTDNIGPARSFGLFIDNANDPSNSTSVLDSAGSASGTNADRSVQLGSVADGDKALSFTFTPTVALPDAVTSGTPDHTVDFQIKVADLAGNWGFSDSDPTDGILDAAQSAAANPDIVTGGYSANVIKIDQTPPRLLATDTTPALQTGDHVTGVNIDGAGNEIADKASIRVGFNDDIVGVEPSDFAVTFDNGTTHTPLSVAIDDNFVYLKLPADVPPADTPTVSLVGAVQDSAGNSSLLGNVSAADGISPTLDVTLTGGSGTGTDSEGPSQLTSKTMIVTVAADEELAAPPTVQVVKGSTTLNLQVLSTGTNTYQATFSGSVGADGTYDVIVKAEDRATVSTNTSTDPANDTNNKFNVDGDSNASFVLDTGVPTNPSVSPAGSTYQTRPFITLDFGKTATSPTGDEASTITVNQILLDGVDQTANLVRSSDGKRVFLVPTSDLAEGDHTVTIPVNQVIDSAGNKNTSEITVTFSVTDRATFNVSIFAGWDAISFPSDPMDPDVNAVFTNPGHDAVLEFDATVPGMYRIATRDAVSGDLTTTAQNGLTSVRSTRAYWVHSNNFEPVEVLLSGETLPGDGSPPSIPQIPTVAGFNAIPVVDASRKQTTGNAGANLLRTLPNGSTTPVTVDDYLGGVDYGRVVMYDPQTLNYITLSDSTVLQTGMVIFVEIIPNSSGGTSSIFP